MDPQVEGVRQPVDATAADEAGQRDVGRSSAALSQIHGFTTGKLRDPAPKVLLAIGQLNLALAAANKRCLREDLPPHHPKCPGVHAQLWQAQAWMQDPRATPWDLSRCSR